MESDCQRIAVVTGASRGIGRAVALALSRFGYFVYVNYRHSSHEAQAVVNDILEQGQGAELLPFDVADSEAVDIAFAKVAQARGGVDVLVNNAGIAIDGLLLRAKNADWDRVLDVNIKGAAYCSRAALKTMLRRTGHRSIVSVSSVVGQMGNAGQTAYAASKSALFGFTKALAQEVASRGITVNAVAPGYVKTDMTEALTHDQKDALLRLIPLRRWAEPEEIASVISFLVSEQAGYITGQVVAVNGGMYL